jgi:hypothetical protein
MAPVISPVDSVALNDESEEQNFVTANEESGRWAVHNDSKERNLSILHYLSFNEVVSLTNNHLFLQFWKILQKCFLVHTSMQRTMA